MAVIPPKQIGILFSGRGSNMLALADFIAQHSKATLALTICNNPEAEGIEKAKAKNIPVAVINHRDYEAREEFDAALTKALRKESVDLVCAAGFMRILSEPFVQEWHNRLLNIHPSLLPKYRGLNTHQRALDAGETYAGCSVHLVRAQVDTGPVLVQKRVKIAKDDTAESLAARLLEQEHPAYQEALEKVLNGEI